MSEANYIYDSLSSLRVSEANEANSKESEKFYFSKAVASTSSATADF
ncbi:hypothetical protein ACSSV9_00800 [Melioribacter sp. OK-6-Me]